MVGRARVTPPVAQGQTWSRAVVVLGTSVLALSAATFTGSGVAIGSSPPLDPLGFLVGLVCIVSLVRFLARGDGYGTILIFLAASFHYQELSFQGASIQLVDVLSAGALVLGGIRALSSQRPIRGQPTIVALGLLGLWGGIVGLVMGAGNEAIFAGSKWILLAGATWAIVAQTRWSPVEESVQRVDLLTGIVAVGALGVVGTILGGWFAGLLALDPGVRPSVKPAAFLAPLALGLAAYRHSRERTALSAAAVALVVVAIVWSASRQLAIIGLGTAAIWFFYISQRRGLLRGGALTVAVVLTSVGLFLAFPSSQVDRFTSRVMPDSVGDATAASDKARWEIASTAISAFQSSPLVGHGAGAFKHIAEQQGYYDPNGALLAGPHSLWLLIAAETGIVGISLIVAAFMAAVASYRRRVVVTKDLPWRVVGLGLALYWAVSLTFGDFGSDERGLMIVTLTLCARHPASRRPDA